MNIESKKAELTKNALEEAINSEIVKKAREYATKCHKETNHKYDEKQYDFHLKMVSDYACKYSYLVQPDSLIFVLASCWTHDVIEDCRQTYNDVKKATNEVVAEITYALTNEKGKNRQERANNKYYAGIRETPFAIFVKLCDRLANIKHSKDNNSRMLDVYRQEQENFELKMRTTRFRQMFDEINELLKL